MLLVFFIVIFTLFVHFIYWKNSGELSPELVKLKHIAHRGYTGNAPENTLESVGAAIEKGFSWVELDVISTKDSKIICSHNFDLERETDGRGFINQLEYKDIKPLSTGIYLKGIDSCSIPLLDDIVKKYKNNISFNLEIKSNKLFDLKTARVLGRYLGSAQDFNVIVSSFNPMVVLYFKIFYKRIKTGFLFENKNYLIIASLIHPHFIHPRVDLLSQKIISYSKKHNVGINTWTVDNAPVRKFCEALPIAGLITDI